MVLIFRYNDKILKFFPADTNIDFLDYINTNLPNNTPYKIVDSIENLTEDDLETLLSSPDGFAINNLF